MATNLIKILILYSSNLGDFYAGVTRLEYTPYNRIDSRVDSRVNIFNRVELYN